MLNTFISKLLFFINLIILFFSLSLFFSFPQNDHETESNDFHRIRFSFYEKVKGKKNTQKKMQMSKRSTFYFILPFFFFCALVCLYAKHQVACLPMCYDCFTCHLGTQYKISQGVCSTTEEKKKKREKNDTNCFLSSLVFKATPQTMHLIIYRTVYSFVAISPYPYPHHPRRPLPHNAHWHQMGFGIGQRYS